MILKNAEQRKAESKGRDKRGKSEGKSTGLGIIPGISREYGNDEIRACGEDSHQRDSFESPKQEFGKIIGQLIDETRKQLAYHEQQANNLMERLEELESLSSEVE